MIHLFSVTEDQKWNNEKEIKPESRLAWISITISQGDSIFNILYLKSLINIIELHIYFVWMKMINNIWKKNKS